METDNISRVKRGELFNEILTVVKKIDRVQTENDAPDHPSVAFELEQVFESKTDVIFKDIHTFYEWAKQKCSTDGMGSWKLVSGGVVYFYSTKELYKDWKSGKLP